MVTQEEFSRVQEFLARKTKARRRKHDFMYTGLIQCKRCGSQVTAALHRGGASSGAYTYYYCSNAKGSCNRQSVPEKYIETIIEDELQRIKIDPTTYEFVSSILDAWQAKQPVAAGSVQRDIASTIAEIKKQQDALLNMKLRDLINDDVFKNKFGELEQRSSSLQSRVEDTQHELLRIRESAKGAVNFRSRAHRRFLIGTVEEKRVIARSLGLSYQLDRGKLAIIKHPALSAHLTFKLLTSPKLSTKKEAKSASVFVGSPEETFSNRLYKLFRDSPSFPELEWL